MRTLSRRRLLGWSLTGATLALLGGLGLWVRRRAVTGPGLRALSTAEYNTLTQLARVIIPRGGAFPIGAADLDLARAFDDFLADEPVWNHDELKRALFLLEWGPLIFERRLTTFTRLDEQAALAHFRSWAESDRLVRRQVAAVFRRFLYMVFYDQPVVWEHLHYDGPLFRLEAAP